MQISDSSIDQARADTLISRADEGRLEELASLYGFGGTRPFSDASLSAFLRVVVYGHKGGRVNFFMALRAFFNHLETPSSGVLTRGPSAVYFTSSEVASAWALHYLDIGGIIYWITRVVGGSAYLTRADSHMITGALEADPIQAEAVNARLIPWTLTERPCEVIVDFDRNLGFPTTYMRELGSARVAPEPFGGHIMDLFGPTPHGDQIDGPYPLYFPSDGSASLTTHFFDKLLPSGVRLTMRERREI